MDFPGGLLNILKSESTVFYSLLKHQTWSMPSFNMWLVGRRRFITGEGVAIFCFPKLVHEYLSARMTSRPSLEAGLFYLSAHPESLTAVVYRLPVPCVLGCFRVQGSAWRMFCCASRNMFSNPQPASQPVTGGSFPIEPQQKPKFGPWSRREA